MNTQQIFFQEPTSPDLSLLLNSQGITLTNSTNTVILGQTGLVSENALRVSSPEMRVVGPVSTPYANNKISFTTEPTFPAIHPSVSITDGTITTSLSTTDLIMPTLIPVAGYTSLIDTLLDITGSSGNYVTVAGPPQIITGEKTFVEPITVVDDAVTPTQTNTITGDALIFSKTSSANNITLNNSPDLVNDFFPYLRIFSESPSFKYRSNLSSETFKIDTRDLADTPIYTTSINSGVINQIEDATASNLDITYGSRIQMRYNDGDTRGIDIYNNKNTEPYIELYSSTALIDNAYSFYEPKQLIFSQTTAENNNITLNNSPDLVNDFYPYLKIKSESPAFKYTSNLTSEAYTQIVRDFTTDDLLFQAKVNAENISIFTGNVETNIVGSNYYRLADNSGTDTIHVTPYSITFKSSGTPINTLTTSDWSGNIQTVNTVANITHYINFSDSAGTGYGHPQKNASLSCNPSTGTITATTFSGSLSGNASSASSISLTSDNTSGTYFIPFSKTVASNSTLFVDNTTTPLTYNPSTATLSASQITLSDGTNTNTLDSLNWSGQIMAKNTSANATHYLLFWDDVNGATYGYPQKNSGISVNPNNHTITATTFIGDLSGTATNATNVNITSNNTSGTYYLPFVSTTGYTDMYIDNSFSTLTYNPASSTIQVVDNLTSSASLGPTELNITNGYGNIASIGHATLDFTTTSSANASYNLLQAIITDGIGNTGLFGSNVFSLASPTETLSITPTTVQIDNGGIIGTLTHASLGFQETTTSQLAQYDLNGVYLDNGLGITSNLTSLTLSFSNGTETSSFGTTQAIISNGTSYTNILSTGITLTNGTITNSLDYAKWTGTINIRTTTSSATHLINFSDGALYGYPLTTTNITCNPSTGLLTATTFSGALSGNATTSTTASNVTLTSDNTSGTYFIPFSKTPASASNQLFVDDSSGPLTYNPSTATLTSTTFSGKLIGNANTSTTSLTRIQTVNISANPTPTYTKKPLTYSKDVSVSTSGIITTLDNPANTEQVYTFGKSIQNMWVAVGNGGTNTIAFSNDGINWLGLGVTSPASPFTTSGNGVCWNGTRWVAVGSGTNTIAYSYDGITWTGLGTSIFSTSGSKVSWGKDRFVACGTAGSNTLAYSYDGLTWTGLGVSVYSTVANNAIWNGAIWVSGGQGTNTIAYSSDGITWTGLGVTSPATPFTTSGNGLCWNGIRWVAVGSGTNSVAYSSDGINWTGLGLTLFSTSAFDVAWSGNVFVACGSSGAGSTLAYSYDGITWVGLGTTIFSSSGRGVNWNGNLFVAVGEGTNNIAYSYNGITWIGLGTSYFTTGGLDVAYNNIRDNTITFPATRIVAVGSGTNTIMYSSNGISWQSSTSVFSTSVNGIQWNGTIWIAVGEGTNTIAYSNDGITWTGLGTSIFSIAGNGLAWNGSIWLAVGSGTNTIAYSTDGITWTGIGTSLLSPQGYGVAWNGTLWVAVGSGTNNIIYSSDGINWSVATNSTPFTSGKGVAWNGTICVAVGSGSNKIAYSSDGINWVSISSPFGTQGNNVSWNGNIWVAVGQGTNSIAYSYDGITWTAGSGTGLFTGSGNSIVWAGNKWVAGGNGGNNTSYSYNGINWIGNGTGSFGLSGFVYGIAWNQGKGSAFIQQPTLSFGNGTNTLAYSSDGINWTGLGASIFSTRGNGAIWNGSIWLAVGEGTNTIVYSSDGIKWTTVLNLVTTAGYGVSWNGTQFVVVGQGTSTISYSTDGITWTSASNTLTTVGRSIVWNGSKWLAGGQGTDRMVSSTNGITWVPITTPFTTAIYGIAWNGTRFVAVGQGTATIAYSLDGITWTTVTSSPFNLSGNGVAWNGNKFVAVGANSPATTVTIAYSSDGITWTAGSNPLAPTVGVSGLFTTAGNGICWNGTRWIAVGQGTYPISYSYDGITWYGLSGTDGVFSIGYGVCSNPRIGPVVVDSTIVLTSSRGVNPSNKLDIISDGYYNTGFLTMSTSITSTILS